MLICMRTSIDIQEELFKAIRKKAQAEGTTLKELIHRGLRLVLKDEAESSTTFRFSWRTEKGKLSPGLRIEDRNQLWDRMSEEP